MSDQFPTREAVQQTLADLVEMAEVPLTEWQMEIAQAVLEGRQRIELVSRRTGRTLADRFVEEATLMLGTHMHMITLDRGTVCLNGGCASADVRRP